jgi:perosamine synthetase
LNDDGVVDAVTRVLESRMVMQGPRVRELEGRVAEMLGVGAQQVVAMNSGTSALEYALSVTPNKGFKVLVPGLAFISDIRAIVMAGLEPVVVDVGPDLQVNRRILEDAYEAYDRVGGVLVVDYAGLPNDMRSIKRWADERDLLVWQDCAHSFGCRPQQQPAGSMADFACYSLYPTKPLPGIGGGLFVNMLEDNPRYHRSAQVWRRYGMTDFRLGTYDVKHEGGNHYMTDVQAAVVLEFLDHPTDSKVVRMNKARCGVAANYHNTLNNSGLQDLVKPPGGGWLGKHSENATFHLFPVVLDASIKRHHLQCYLKGEGIETGTHYPYLHRLSLYEHVEKAPTPYLDSIEGRLLTLPCHHEMTREDVRYVVQCIVEYLRRVK